MSVDMTMTKTEIINETEEAMDKKQLPRELYLKFEYCSFRELEEQLLNAHTHEEKAFYRVLLNLKLQIAQERVVGERLL